MRIRIYKYNAKWMQLFCFCLYRFFLSLVYEHGVVPTYGYLGYTADLNYITDLICWQIFLVYAVRLIFIGNDGDTVFSKTVVYTLFLMIYTPFSVAISYGMYDFRFAVANNIYWFVLIFFLAACSRKKLGPVPRLVAGNYKIGERFINIFGFLSLGVIIMISWRYTRFRINLSILNVYDLRTEALNYNLPTLVRYLFGWTRIINSICLCISLIRRKKIMSLVYFFNQVLSFGIDGMKSSMFILVLDILIYIMYRMHMYRNEFSLLAFGFNAASVGALLEMVVLHSKWLIFLLFYRMEFLPVRISYHFYDFFTTHEPDYFRTSFLRLFGAKSPYNSINYMISGVYSGDYTSQANNGLISDAITNMGYVGIIVMPVILVLFFRFFDQCSQGINKYLVLALGLYCAMTMSNMFFFPSLLTGGWLVALVIVTFIDREQTYYIRK